MSIPPVPTVSWERVRQEAWFYGALTVALFAVFVIAGFLLELAAERIAAFDHDHLLVAYLANNHITAPLTVAAILAAATGALRFTVKSITRPITELKEEFKASVEDRRNLWQTQHNIAVVANNAADTSNRVMETCNLVLERLERHERSSTAHAPRKARTA